MIRAFVVLVISLLAFIENSNAETKSFCQNIFGEKSAMTYEPMASNSGAVVTDYATRPPDIKRKAGVPLPKGFRCGLFDLAADTKVCPSGMHLDKKRLGRTICLSKEFPIKEICPTEIDNGWPGLGEKLCKPAK